MGRLLREFNVMNVLFFVDVRGWAWDIKSQNIAKYINGNVDIIYQVENTEIDFAKYDVIVTYGKNQLDYVYCKENYRARLYQGITSHHNFKQPKYMNELRKRYEYYDYFFVNNRFLYNQLKQDFDRVWLCENGVDLGLFKQTTLIPLHKKTLTVGCVGNSGSRTDKGFYNYIKPACDIRGVELRMIDRSYTNMLPHDKMVEFYNDIDCYICASEYEGTPNPCLEAAACGRPLITTRVGNMPELVRHGENGMFIEREIVDIKNKLYVYRDNRYKLIEHSNNISRDIKLWDWYTKAQNFIGMFNE